MVGAFVKIRHTRESGYPGTLKLPEKTRFRFHRNDGEKLFGNFYTTTMVAVVQK
jgi:hypothetical protein